MVTAARERWRRWLLVAAAVLGITIVVIALANPRITRYVEGPEFRAELEKQTAKGLHFPNSTFAPIRRTGFLTGATDRVQAPDGEKALTDLDARGISARFNPLGVFLRRWQLDDLHIEGGEVGIQVYEPQPTPTPSKPWFHIFLPDRVYLKRVWSEPGDITWQMRGEKGGIFGTRLLITPHGRDFEYRATGGTLKNALIPDLPLRHTHLLITKKVFDLYTLELAAGDGTIRAWGNAETTGAKRIDFKAAWENVLLREWLPSSWTASIRGSADGDVHWTGEDFKIETARLEGALRVNGGRISDLKFLEQLAAVSRRSDLKALQLNECGAAFTWDKRAGELRNIVLEETGKFRIEGSISFSEASLGGKLELGIAPEYLAWLPDYEEVFSRND
ncbi:MAG TPA: hypothetical protein VG095_07760, partial [Chthoniobacterales bacterium]|nr:hypothetical protein [Chthoniobacterales bacterium]